MSIITTILATLVALEHFYIFYLESMATHSDTTSRVFNMDKEELGRPSVNVIKLRNSNTILYLGFFFYVLN